MPGELARVMGIMADCGINVTYSYRHLHLHRASVKDIARAEKLLAAPPELIGQTTRPPRSRGKPVIRVTDITVKGAVLPPSRQGFQPAHPQSGCRMARASASAPSS
ncbi:MAG: hypothetical protein ACLSVD_08035 [Eggerthellaceae bacterium]